MLLQTERLSLVPLKKKDLTIFHNTNTDPFVRKFLWDDEVITLEVSERFANENWGLWKIIDTQTNEHLGYAGFWYFFDEPQPQLLYALLPESTGKGIATEASRRLITYAFDDLGFEYITAAKDKPNIDSAKVCKRLAMTLVEEKEAEGMSTLFYRLRR